MENLKDINNNPLSRKWKEKYNEQPDEVKKRLDELSNQDFTQYQLNIIKRRRIIPKKGDVFLVNPKEPLYFFGIVINDNIKNINGEGLYVIMIFKDRAKSLDDTNFNLDYEKLLIEPSIVGKEYWTRGYFYNTGITLELLPPIDYGFYSVGKQKYFDEYGNEIFKEPYLLGTFGVATISGIAYEINKELIIDSSLIEN